MKPRRQHDVSDDDSRRHSECVLWTHVVVVLDTARMTEERMCLPFADPPRMNDGNWSNLPRPGANAMEPCPDRDPRTV